MIPESTKRAYRRTIQLVACDLGSEGMWRIANEFAWLERDEIRDTFAALAGLARMFMEPAGYLEPDKLAHLLDLIAEAR